MRHRGATSADVEVMAVLAQTAGVVGWSVAGLRDSLLSPLTHAGVVEDAGRILGFSLARVVADEAELLLIAVATERRRCGLGRGLYGAFEAGCLEAEVERIHLEVAESNTAARALYAGLGFEAVGRREAYYADGGAALLMTKPLGPKSIV